MRNRAAHRYLRRLMAAQWRILGSPGEPRQEPKLEFPVRTPEQHRLDSLAERHGKEVYDRQSGERVSFPSLSKARRYVRLNYRPGQVAKV